MTTAADQSAVNSKIYAVCDIMRRSNCASALQYIPELTWLLFLRVLDEREELEAEEADAVGAPFRSSLEPPYRWRDWAAPNGAMREELQSGALGETFGFVNEELLPALHELGGGRGATPRQRVISQIMRAVESVRIDSEKNFLDVVDGIHDITSRSTDPTHVFLLSQAYEGLLLRMGEKNNDGGQFFTPREVIRAMVRAVDPAMGETVYDPGCGTGGFLAQSYEHMKAGPGDIRHRRPVGEPRHGHLLRTREGEPHPPHRPRQPRAPRHRPAEHMARQHPHQEWRPTAAYSRERPTSSTSS